MEESLFGAANQDIKPGVIVGSMIGMCQKNERTIDDVLHDIAKWRYLKLRELREYELLEFIDFILGDRK